MQENELVALAAGGDRDAFSQLTEQHLPMVYNRILGTGADPDRAFDLTRETFLRAWHGISLFQQDEPFAQWLEYLADDVAGTAAAETEAAAESPVPEQLHEAIMRRIDSERSSEILKESLRRFRFTLVALILVLILFFVSRLAGKTEGTAPSPSPEPSAAAEETEIPDAALQPGE